MQGHLEKMEIIDRRDKKSGLALSPLIYSWVNITCHVSSIFLLISPLLAGSSAVVRSQLLLSADNCLLRAGEQQVHWVNWRFRRPKPAWIRAKVHRQPFPPKSGFSHPGSDEVELDWLHCLTEACWRLGYTGWRLWLDLSWNPGRRTGAESKSRRWVLI